MTVDSGRPETPIDHEAIRRKYEQRQRDLDATYERWRDQPLLADCPEDRRRVVAAILENQCLAIQVGNFWPPEQQGFWLAVTAKVFKSFVGFDLVSVQPLFGPADDVYYLAFGHSGEEITLQHRSREILARTKKLPTGIPATGDLSGQADVIAKEIRSSITKEILFDLRNNVGTVAARQIPEGGLDYEDVYCRLVEMSGIIHRKSLRGRLSWVVAGPELAKLLWEKVYKQGGQIADEMPNLDECRYLGTLCCAWRVYGCPWLGSAEAVCGGHEPLLNGYVYSPYVPLMPTPTVLDPESFNPRRGLLTRYSKYLFKASSYARLTFTEAETKKEFVDAGLGI